MLHNRTVSSILRGFAAAFAIVLYSWGSAAGQPASIPKPESVLGFGVGDDFKLATYDESLAYFRQLDAATPKLQLIEVGATSEERPWYAAVISSPENLAGLDQYRQTAHRLAHPAGLTDETARQLARQGKAIVHIDGGLHASEVAGAQHTIQLAYDLVSTTDDPRITGILDNVIVMLWPSLNPDGQNIVVNWYRSNLGTPYEVAPLVQLYQKYLGHDNNRDAYMLNMIESRVIARVWREWEPQIIYVHHQTAPFPTRIWLPPFAEPIAAQAPPLMSRTVNTIGMAIAQGLESRGMVGATHMGTGFDAWYPGYIDYLPMLQHRAAFWTETALYRYATPHFYTVRDFPPSKRDLRPETLYPSPWKGGWWRLRDAVDYMLVASISVLDYAAKYREDLLYNRYQSGRDTIARYRNDAPYAFFVPQDQRDPVAAVELLRRLAFNGIRIHELSAPVRHEGIAHPAGTWVIAMDQEYAELARQVLEIQTYPDLREYPEGPPEQPYDAAGWTLPYQMDVRIIEARAPLSESTRGAMTRLSGTAAAPASGGTDTSLFDSVPGVGFDTDAVASAIRPPEGSLTGNGAHIRVDPAQNNAFRAINQTLKAGGEVRFTETGHYLLSGVDSQARAWVRDLALKAERTESAAGTRVSSRIALYKPWTASMDEGWTRWVLEQYGFTFTNITDTDFRSGQLSRFDVIILPSARPSSLLNGHDKGVVPPRYEGGIGESGVRALADFVRAGGTLVCLNQSSNFAIEQLHLPVENVVSELSRQEYFSGSSILEVTVDTAHPVMAGMPEKSKIFVDRSPVFTTLEGFEGTALAAYETTGSPLLSGYLLGEQHIQGHAAALDVKLDKGHVILLGFRPQWRGQPFGTFRVLFSSVLYTGELASQNFGTPGFGSPDKEP